MILPKSHIRQLATIHTIRASSHTIIRVTNSPCKPKLRHQAAPTLLCAAEGFALKPTALFGYHND